MFNSFNEFFWAFMSLSGIMFWICFVVFVMLIIKRKRNKQGAVYEL
jgi:hypothetical protein